MASVLITNSSFYDKSYFATFVDGEKYKHFSVDDISSTLVPDYIELLRTAIGDKVDEQFQDFELSKEQTKSVKKVVEKKLTKILEARKTPKDPPNKKITFQGKDYELNLSLTNVTDRIINDYFLICNIAEECLLENKSMYLSIE